MTNLFYFLNFFQHFPGGKKYCWFTGERIFLRNQQGLVDIFDVLEGKYLFI